MLATAARTRTSLADVMTGPVVVAGDGEWDSARQGFDLTVDLRPDAVAFPIDERDVVAAVNYARQRGLRIAPQSTGHNAGPLGALDDTILLDTSKLTGVSVDAAARRVRVGSATRWKDVGSYRRALSSYDVKMAAVPTLSRAVDEPSAYGPVGRDDRLEQPVPRQLD